VEVGALLAEARPEPNTWCRDSPARAVKLLVNGVMTGRKTTPQRPPSSRLDHLDQQLTLN
jgi:hypothetical protein